VQSRHDLVFDHLRAEQEQIEEILSGLTESDWHSASGAPGWTVADVVLHLAQTEEVVAASAAGDEGPLGWGIGSASVDSVVDRWVREERAAPSEVFRRWREARRNALAGLTQADPQARLRWVKTPLRPATLATTRLAEHWAHALDITGPLGIPYPDTERLWHIAWLGHRTLPYAFELTGETSPDIFCDLVAPDGTAWRFGPPDAESTISGPAGAFCRVGARRLGAEDSGLVTQGQYGATALRVLRNYAA